MIEDKKIKQGGYLESYLQFGFIESLTNRSRPYCLLCSRSYSNESMRKGKLKEHFKTVHEKEHDFPILIFELLKPRHIIDRSFGTNEVQLPAVNVSNESLLECSFFYHL